MVTFSQLRYVDLGGLDAAAGGFEKILRGWDLTSRMQNDVIGAVQHSGWHGDTAGTASAALTTARDHIHNAFEEGSAIGRALRDAHTELAGAKRDLETALLHAADKGLTVADDGSVHWPPPADRADRNDPDYAAVNRTNAALVAKEIGAALDRATEADSAAANALALDTGNDTGAFNPLAVGGIAEADAADAARIVRAGGAATDAELAHLRSLLQQHGHDPDAYAAIAAGQQAYTTAQIQDVLAHPELHKDLAVAVENVAKPAGQVNGIITSAMVEEVYEKQTSTDAEYNAAIDTKRELAGQVWSFAAEAFKERAPLVCEGVDVLVNHVMDSFADSYKVDTQNEAIDKAGTVVKNAEANAQQAIVDAVSDAGRGTGADPNYINDVARRAAQEENAGYGSGKDSYETAFPKEKKETK
ncbi:hypothetical protein ACIQ9P_26240 [Kitasatospora sp. NPDC094019]|uniref:hypothetical protein n=1 Tax=Kitasatospora sp. NPDC094019 TaxID=3364091 RepID=UPI0037F81A41